MSNDVKDLKQKKAYRVINVNIAGCLKNSIWKLINQNKFFDRTIDVIFDDPYLTEQKDSANGTEIEIWAGLGPADDSTGKKNWG